MKGESNVNGPGIVPLRTILLNFLNHVEDCEAGRNGEEDRYDREFQELKLFSENLKTDGAYMCTEGEKTVNRKKNRYKDILPFDYSRVLLGDYGDVPGSDYINANFIKGASGSSAYIACQGPLPHTVNDFWRMVVECEVQVIVMACNEEESGKHKCENYWVEEDGVERQFGQVTVWLKKCRNVCPDFLVRTMRIRYTNVRGENEERNVCQFHYSAWPDHGVPSKVRPLLDMVRLIRDCQTSETLPVLVHCSAGCGRTGTICAIDYVWGLLRLGKLSQDFSLFVLVREMRRQRIAMVQTKDQYILVHRAVKELFQEQLKIIDSHPYANVDENGLPLEIKAELQEPTYETIQILPQPVHCTNNGESVESIPSESTCSVQINVKSVCPSESITQVEPTLSGVVSTSQGQTCCAPNSKLEKETENHLKHQEESKEKIAMMFRADKTNYVALSKRDDNSEREKSSKVFPPEKSNGSRTEQPIAKGSGSASSSGSSAVANVGKSLLRKPSINRLKAFFEKSKEDKEKSSGTHLSRAKSDVSSRFNSFNNLSFARFHSPTASRKNQSSDKDPKSAVDKPSSSNDAERSVRATSEDKDDTVKLKLPLFMKPKLPVKRSKSLKIPMVSSNTSLFESELTRNNQSSTTKDSHYSTLMNLNDSKDFGPVVASKIVSVTQAPTYDYPKIQGGQLVQEKRTLTLDDSFCGGSNSTNASATNTVAGREASAKPSIPSRSHILRDNHNYVNVSHSSSGRIKMGVTSDYEQLKSLGRSRSPDVDKSYNRSIPANSKFGTTTLPASTSLTRSQSHVWQAEKIQTASPVRIFSDENIHQSSALSQDGCLGADRHIYHSVYPKSNPSVPKNVTDSFLINLLSQSTSAQGSSSSSDATSAGEKLLPSSSSSCASLQRQEISSSTSKPAVVRRRLPKTNPYANFPSNLQVGRAATLFSSDATNPVPPLKESTAGTVTTTAIKCSSLGNSSDSSSNANTPRNSLPGTPTFSLDSGNLKRNSLQGSGSSVSKTMMNGNGPPKSILKGSLSSTPSESDERLDNCRPAAPIPGTVTTLPPIPHPHTVRIAVGVRERRNSFRQAVWKEAQPPMNPTKPQASSLGPFAVSSGIVNSNGSGSGPMSNSTSSLPVIKSHRNYEPIWPDANMNQFRLGSATGPILSEQQHSRQTSAISGSLLFPESSVTSYEDSRMNGSNNLPNSVFQARVDQMHKLLEELKTPYTASSNHSNRTDLCEVTTDKLPSGPMTKSNNVSTSGGLRYQRSLREPIRQYEQQGLSCFTFKKPSSFESITDQLRLDESNSVNAANAPRGAFAASRTDSEEGGFPIQGRHMNDYVSLRQCRSTVPNGGQSDVEDAVYSSIVRVGKDNMNMPIPPPRTKRQFGSRKDYEDSVDSCGPPLSVWAGGKSNCSDSSSHDNPMSSQQPSSSSIHPTSPKSIIRALGLFQAKAANVRSKLANWTDAKERSKKQNGTVMFSNAEKDSTRTDLDLSAQPRGATATGLTGPTRSKHQYL